MAAIDRRDLDEPPRSVAADVIDHNAIIHGEEETAGAAFEGFRQQLIAFDPSAIAVKESIAEGDRVVARVVQRGVHGGTHLRRPEPTSESFENEAIWIFTQRDGQIGAIGTVSDRLGLSLRLGWDRPIVD